MTISEMIARLSQIRDDFGDIQVRLYAQKQDPVLFKSVSVRQTGMLGQSYVALGFQFEENQSRDR